MTKPLNIEDEIKAKLDQMGFKQMTDVQQKVIPEFLSKDVIVQSQTGTGKTLSYLIPIVNSIIKTGRQGKLIHALIIAPTRELCNQIEEVVQKFDITSRVFIGGTPLESLESASFEIAIGTPGRLLEIIAANTKAFGRIRYLVLDECDKLMSLGFDTKLLKIVEYLPKNRLTGLFSATIDESLTKISQKAVRNPVTIKISESIPEKLSFEYVTVSPIEKLEVLSRVRRFKKAIVFFSTCNTVDFYYAVFKELGDETVPIHKIHGKMDQKDRNTVYAAFEEKAGILLCTDVAARGIDFKKIELIVHFDIPKDHANIVHRSGRAARMGAEGRSLLLLMQNESAFINFLNLKGITPQQITINEIETGIDCNKETSIDCDKEYSKCDKEYSECDKEYNECKNENKQINREFDKEDWNIDLLKSKMNPDLLKLSVNAFVSYIRSYKEHILNYILNYKELDFDGIAELHCLEKIPSMNELKNVKFKKYERNPVKRAKLDKQ